ncbi:MAG: DUF434 domain-containing protein [Phycisphaerae bacterium]|nr:DUF434 domain-containing protein [Phycisphaerae bacterium]
MPDKRSHRGPHPEDAKLFTADTQAVLSHATADMSWLLSRGYADKSSLKLIGDRYNLTKRQRMAVMRCGCSDRQSEHRTARQVPPEGVADRPVVLDGYNVLITVEAALGGGVLFIARDGCVRDLASIHGTYRKVAETLPAIEIIAEALNKLQVRDVTWFLDKPVSNSGRLKQLIGQYAAEKGLKWTVELVQNPDKDLIESDSIIASSDSVVLDNCNQWFNLAGFIVDTIRTELNLHLLDLSETQN